MNKRKRVGESTEPCGTPLFIVLGVEQSPSTTAEMERSERKLEMKELSASSELITTDLWVIV